MTDLYRLDALEYDFASDIRTKHTTSDFKKARNKIVTADAYLGVYFDQDNDQMAIGSQ